jgi:hypothetical protein
MKINKNNLIIIGVWVGLLLFLIAINYPRFRPLKVNTNVENPQSPLLVKLLSDDEFKDYWSWSAIYTKQEETKPTNENFYLDDWASKVFLGYYRGNTARVVQKISLYQDSDQELHKKIIVAKISPLNKEGVINLNLSPVGENFQQLCTIDSDQITCTVFNWYGNILSELSVVLSNNISEEEATKIINEIVIAVDMKAKTLLLTSTPAN